MKQSKQMQKVKNKFVISIFLILGFVSLSAFAGVLVDETNVKVESKNYQRIVSLAPSVSEILGELKMDKEIIGVDSLTNYPVTFSKKSKVGFAFKINIEEILRLKPDLVIATKEANSKAEIEKLRELKQNIFVVQSDSLDDLKKSINQISEIINKKQQGNDVITKFEKKITCINSKLAKTKPTDVMLAINVNPLFVVGGRNFLNDGIEMAKGKNVFVKLKSRFPRLNVEEIIKNPKAKFVASRAKENAVAWEEFTKKYNVKIDYLEEDLISRPTIRFLDAIIKLANILHPEIVFNCES